MDKIKLSELMHTMEHKICGGGKYNSQCYGKNARLMMFGDDDNLVFGECVFDANNLMVYEVSYLQGRDDRDQSIRYVWRHPDYKAAYRKEAALLRETKNWTELPYKQFSLDSVLDCLKKHLP
jgi:hypothetical protein